MHDFEARNNLGEPINPPIRPLSETSAGFPISADHEIRHTYGVDRFSNPVKAAPDIVDPYAQNPTAASKLSKDPSAFQVFKQTWDALPPTLREIFYVMGLIGTGVLFHLPSAVQALNFIPLIRATRNGGRFAGTMVALVSVTMAGLLEGLMMSPLSMPVIFLQSFLRIVAYTMTIGLVESMMNRLEHTENLALTDPLTGVLNRLGFANQVEALLGRSLVAERNAILALVDLDDFKKLNDLRGHQFGDRILQTMVRCIQPALANRNGIFGRTGGDEFQLVFVDSTREEVDRALHRAAARFSDETLVLGHRSTFSFGLSETEVVGYKLTNLVEAADIEMYHRKAHKHITPGMRWA